jgi:hypothetical protein
MIDPTAGQVHRELHGCPGIADPDDDLADEPDCLLTLRLGTPRRSSHGGLWIRAEIPSLGADELLPCVDLERCALRSCVCVVFDALNTPHRHEHFYPFRTPGGSCLVILADMTQRPAASTQAILAQPSVALSTLRESTPNDAERKARKPEDANRLGRTSVHFVPRTTGEFDDACRKYHQSLRHLWHPPSDHCPDWADLFSLWAGLLLHACEPPPGRSRAPPFPQASRSGSGTAQGVLSLTASLTRSRNGSFSQAPIDPAGRLQNHCSFRESRIPTGSSISPTIHRKSSYSDVMHLAFAGKSAIPNLPHYQLRQKFAQSRRPAPTVFKSATA